MAGAQITWNSTCWGRYGRSSCWTNICSHCLHGLNILWIICQLRDSWECRILRHSICGNIGHSQCGILVSYNISWIFFYHGSRGCCWCLLNWRRRCCITSMIQLQEVILECSKQLHGCVRTVIGMAWFRMCRFALILLLSAGRTCGLGWTPVHLYSVSRLVTQERGCIWIFSAQSWRTTMANSMYWRW